MSVENLKKKIGRIKVEIVELDVEKCSLQCGVAPCTSTEPEKCYNSFATCQDKANFSSVTKTFRFSTKSADIPNDLNIIPCVNKIDIAPTEIRPNGLSVRASVNVTMHDFTFHDRLLDPYFRERAEEPKGTFWGRFLARFPYITNREIRIKRGYVDPVNGFDKTLNTDFETHTYFMDSMTNPDARGNISIKCKDILKYVEEEKVKAPVKQEGELLNALAFDGTTLTLKSGQGSLYPASGRVRIGDEVIAYTNVNGDSLEGLTRADLNTVAENHSASADVQEVLSYEDVSIIDVLYDLLVTRAGIDASFIPLTEWQDEYTTWLTGLNVTTHITEPVGISTLLGELSEHLGFYLWWSEKERKIKFKVVAPPLPGETIKTLTDEANLIESSVKPQRVEKERYTQIHYYYNKRSFVGDDDDKYNYNNVYILGDTDAESVNAHGESKIKTIRTRWVTSNSFASSVAERFLSRFVFAPYKIDFNLDAKDSDVKTGDTILINTRLIQNSKGENEEKRFIVLKIKENNGGTLTGTALEYSGIKRVSLWASNEVPNYSQATELEQATNGFWTDSDGKNPDGTNGSVWA